MLQLPPGGLSMRRSRSGTFRETYMSQEQPHSRESTRDDHKAGFDKPIQRG
jgi:hypothetical protein